MIGITIIGTLEIIMDKMNAHLTANLSIIFLLWVLILTGVWSVLDTSILFRIILSVVSFVVCGYAGHRIIPRITGPVIEKMYQNQEMKSQQ